MKTKLLILFILINNLLHAQEWKDVSVFENNREPARSTFYSFSSIETALKGNRESSPYFVLLNGTWKFNWAKNPASRPADFYQPTYNVQNWDDLLVPSNWEMKGYGEAIYSGENHPQMFVQDTLLQPTQVPEFNNPVGSYRTSFTIPENWDNRRVMLGFEGVKSAFYVWVNGQKVGYSEGSTNTAEFNVTPLLNKRQ
ncbi:MAG: hypothetical protein HC896_17245 [Bacteroidales bacterium]|nr:hypothetical protein [Bacteroidales bacterium]